ncbi:MAG TPA: class I SAM-dependent methyltransferase [Polyangiaceae bacterium]|jgi:SAM-dependent methyltransferase
MEPSVAAETPDARTAAAFATSWNTVGDGPVYTRAQFVDWFAPIEPESLAGTSVLELGFGNGSLLHHVGACSPSRLAGIELGDTLAQAHKNLAHLPPGMLELHRGDLTTADLGQFDLVYCIGVLHHLDSPRAGFEAALRHTRPGGRFHCWVYAEEGNGLVIHAVDPIRRVACRLPWWLTKYGVALPLAVPYFAYAKTVRALSNGGDGLRARIVSHMPLADYSRWIAERRFPFFHHVAFDQLVTPRTHYISRATVDSFLRHPDVDPASTYVVFRNGNSWKFGGRRRRA